MTSGDATAYAATGTDADKITIDTGANLQLTTFAAQDVSGLTNNGTLEIPNTNSALTVTQAKGLVDDVSGGALLFSCGLTGALTDYITAAAGSVLTNFSDITARHDAVPVTVTGTMTTAQNLTDFDKVLAATTGVATATIQADHAEITGQLGNATTNDLLAITVDDKVTVSEGANVIGKTGGTVNFTLGVEDPNFNALGDNMDNNTNLSTGLTAITSKDSDVPITVTGSIAMTSSTRMGLLNNVLGATSGDVTIPMTLDSAEVTNFKNNVTDTNTATNKLTITISGSLTTNAQVTNLRIIADRVNNNVQANIDGSGLTYAQLNTALAGSGAYGGTQNDIRMIGAPSNQSTASNSDKSDLTTSFDALSTESFNSATGLSS